MRRKVFFQIFIFGVISVISTAGLTAFVYIMHFDEIPPEEALYIFTDAWPYIVLVFLVILILSIGVSYAVTRSIIKPIEKLGKNLDDIEKMNQYKELLPFVESVKSQNRKKQLLEKQKKQFTANISHELKTPLTSIAGYAELIENGMADENDIKPFANTIRKQALRMVNLAEDIIKLSQLEEQDNEILFESVNLYGVCSECISVLKMNAQSKNITLTLLGEEAYIRANKSLLEELLYTLCDNAIRYNKENGSVTIAIERDGAHTVLSVSDTGIGIPDKYLDRVFERFFRVDKSRSKETGGTGLGLAIVKHIAEVHNAQITIDSKLDEGTTIRIYFS